MLPYVILLLSPKMETIAFISPVVSTRRFTSLQGMLAGDGGISGNNTNTNGSNENGNTPFNVEQARQRLENLLSNSEIESNGNNANSEIDENVGISVFSKVLSNYEAGEDFSLSSFPEPPPLSSVERERRLVEIQLLRSLFEGDDAVSELWNHWYSERGYVAKSRLEEIGGKFTDPKNWDECERDLIKLIDEYGVYFVEPVNLLATLYFLRGKLELSYKLCQIVLDLKPYHVGALSGIVQVSLGLNDLTESRRWAQKRLPKLSSDPALRKDGSLGSRREEMQYVDNSERIEWVEKAVTAANILLRRAERRTRKNFFGKPDVHYDNFKDNDAENDSISGVNTFDDNSSDSAWQ